MWYKYNPMRERCHRNGLLSLSHSIEKNVFEIYYAVHVFGKGLDIHTQMGDNSTHFFTRMYLTPVSKDASFTYEWLIRPWHLNKFLHLFYKQTCFLSNRPNIIIRLFYKPNSWMNFLGFPSVVFDNPWNRYFIYMSTID